MYCSVSVLEGWRNETEAGAKREKSWREKDKRVKSGGKERRDAQRKIKGDEERDRNEVGDGGGVEAAREREMVREEATERKHLSESISV